MKCNQKKTLPRITEPADGVDEGVIHQYVLPNSTFVQLCAAQAVPTPEVLWIKGQYTCIAKNDEGQTERRMVLHITYGAIINKTSLSNKTVIEGDAVLWRCSVDKEFRQAQPNSTQFKWLRDGLPISFLEVGLRSHINNGEFGIVSVKKSDHGWYVCEASNGFIKPDSANVFLDVQYKPTISTSQIHFYTIPSNSSSQIECRFEANPPVTLIQWTKNGQPVPNPPPSNPFMQVENASENDSGVYTCRAQNAVGSSALVEVHVLVVEPPQFSTLPPPFVYISVGQRLEMECQGFGDPMPTQFWSRNGKKLPLSTPYLVIPYIGQQDHGIYECTISNSVATLSHQMKVYVENTYPQCPTSIQVNCVGQQSLKLSWTPGYSSTKPQLFRIFHRQVAGNKDWKASEFINFHDYVLGNLQEFGAYEFSIEASNKFGEVNCTLPRKEYYTCSILHPPTNLRLENRGNEIDKSILVRWDKVLEASSYEVKYRPENCSAYRKLSEVKEPEIRLDRHKLNFNHSIELTVQSLRPFYNFSEPSEKIVYFPAKTDPKFTNGYLVVGGLVVIILCFCLMLVNRKKKLDNKRCRISEQKQREVFGNYMFPHNLVSNEWWEEDDQGTSLNTTSCQESLSTTNSLADRPVIKSNGYLGNQRVDDCNQAECEDGDVACFYNEDRELVEEFRHDGSVAMREMWRQKYIYKTDILKKSLDVMDELRIERLRLEMGNVLKIGNV